MTGAALARVEAPTWADLLVEELLGFTPTRLRAAIVILHDHVVRAFLASDGSYISERCAGYFVPHGTISRDIARQVFPDVYALLGAEPVTTPEAARLGYPVRDLAPGQGRGTHYRVTPEAHAIAEQVLEALAGQGHAPPVQDHRCYGPAVQVPGHRKGQKVFIRCPNHEGHSPNAVVNQETGYVFCFSCETIIGKAKVLEDLAVLFQPVVSVKASPACLRLCESGDPGGIATPGLPHRGSYWDVPVSTPSNALFLVDRSLEAGDPGPAPMVLGKPSGLAFYDDPLDISSPDYVVRPQGYGFTMGKHYGGENESVRRGFHRAFSAATSLTDLLHYADGRAKNEKVYYGALAATNTMMFFCRPKAVLPDLYVSMDLHGFTGVREFSSGRESMNILQPTGFVPVYTEWVGVDIDDIETMPEWKHLAEAAQEVQAILVNHPVLSGTMAMVRTSGTGVQVVVKLRQGRWDPRAFYADPHVQRMLASLDRVVLDALHAHGVVGGHADPSIHSAGRYVRRPGPRVDKQGMACVARLVWCSEPPKARKKRVVKEKCEQVQITSDRLT